MIDYGPIEDFLVGRCGMTQKQAACTSLLEYQQRIRGKEEERHEAWELARWVIFHKYLIAPFLKRRPSKVTDVATFPWDKTKTKKASKRSARVQQWEKDALAAIMTDFLAKRNQTAN